MKRPLAAALAATLLTACATPPAALDTVPAGERTEGTASALVEDAYPSTYVAPAAPPVLITGATVLTGTGERLDGADVLLRDGRIEAVGRGLDTADAVRVDGTGKWVTPGLIDVHSHLGVYPSPGARAHSDGNEMTAPVTANVWAEHSVWPQDPGFDAARAGGI